MVAIDLAAHVSPFLSILWCRGPD